MTGGAGYIGSHTARALAGAGYPVVIVDDLSAGHRRAVGALPLVEAEVGDTEAVRSVLRRYRVRAVLHFAARVSVPESLREPAAYYRTNVGGALSVLEAMAAESVGRFVFSSTAAVYGEPQEVPIAETHPTRPLSPYGETKLAVERALPFFESACGIRFTVLRYFNAAGAAGELGEDHRPETHLIPRALEAAVGGEPLDLFGEDYATPDGTCLRDYVHVSDLASAHMAALRALDAGRPSTVYNVGTGRPHSVREVIAEVERVTGRPVARRVASRRPGDPAVLTASADRIRQALGWEPRYTLGDMIESAWRWRCDHPSGFGRSHV